MNKLDDTMIKKTLKCLVSKVKYVLIIIVTLLVGIVIQCEYIFEQKISVKRDFQEGGQSILEHLYLNDSHSKISYKMFLHDYILACEISMVRTVTSKSSFIIY